LGVSVGFLDCEPSGSGQLFQTTQQKGEMKKATAPSRFSTPYSMYPYSEILQPETEHLVALSGTEVKTLKLRRRETYASN
jgi:hypothetical protein